jgi:hypothetical protein
MFSGMVFGVSEATSNMVSGSVCKYLKDWHAFLGSCTLCIFGQQVYYFSGANQGGLLALFGLSCTVMGFGSALNIVFIMIELRMPTDRLGSSMVIVVTSAVFYSSFASYIAYLP